VIASYHFNFFIHLHFRNCRHKNILHESLWFFQNDTVPASARNVNLKIFVSFTSISAVSCLSSLKNKLVNLRSNESVCAQINAVVRYRPFFYLDFVTDTKSVFAWKHRGCISKRMSSDEFPLDRSEWCIRRVCYQDPNIKSRAYIMLF